MILNVVEFMKSIGKNDAPKVLLFVPGKSGRAKKDTYEPFLVEMALDKVMSTYVDPGMKDLIFSSFYAEETAPGSVIEEARTLPFLAERRVILVRNAHVYMDMASDKRSPLQPLLQYLEAPADTTLLILVSQSVNRSKALYKLAEAQGVVIEASQLSTAEYQGWIKEQIDGRGKTIHSKAVALLIDRVGAQMSDMSNALNLIVNFVQPRDKITEEDVLAASADVAEATVWALTDAIAESNAAAALKELHDLIAMDKSADEILGIVNWLLESAYRAHPHTHLKLDSPFVARKVQPLTQKFSPKRLAAAMALCTKTHFALRNTNADMSLLLELLIIKLAHARK
ncbi:MAG: DNA polymerase III subunit delta [Candidatus Hydrogenedentes bacterium]|nr:DNA polymerase III subunit delta [Candidatus Hydrogenedentota bacterium]